MRSPLRVYLWIASAGCVAIAGWSALGGVVLRVIWAAREKQQAEWDDPFAPPGAPSPGEVAQAAASTVSSSEPQVSV